MKITLIGDFSGLHAYLHKGFLRLGHECTLFSNGDGFKHIPGGKPYGPNRNHTLGVVRWAIDQPRWLERQFVENDLIQLINPYSLWLPNSFETRLARSISSAYRSFILNRLHAVKQQRQTKFGLAVAGCSALVIDAMGRLERSPCEGCKQDANVRQCVHKQDANFSFEQGLYLLSDAVIPFGGHAYEQSARNDSALPMPIASDELPYSKNVVRDRVRILHGINRPGFKGTAQILRALENISRKFGDKVEIVMPNRLPFVEYVKLLSSCNIIVDQLFGDGLGMNSLISMALGRIVLTSYDKECIEHIYGVPSPAFDIDSESSVYSTLTDMICHWDEREFIDVGQKSRSFVERCCDPARVAAHVLNRYGFE